MTALRTAVLLSGGGRTLQNLLDLRARGEVPIDVALVVSSSPDAYGLVRAQQAGIPTRVLRRADHADTGDYARAVFGACREAGAELVLMAGWLKLVRPIPDDYRGKVLNIHPALLPAFGGKGFYGDRVHAAVLEQGAKVTGCTAHYVDDEYDHGPIVLQEAVPVRDDDDVRTLAARVFEAECRVFPEAIRLHAAGRLEIAGRRVRIL